MNRVIYFDWFEDATSFYRLAPLSYIDKKGISITKSNEKNVSWATLLNYDTVVIERPSSNESVSIIKLAKDMGIRVIIDYDDDVLHIDHFNPMYDFYVHQKQNVIESIVLADEVWVSTESLKKSFRLFNRNIQVINNAHNNDLFHEDDKKPFTFNKIAMYRGGESHEGDIYDIGTPETIIEMINSNPDWRFYFLGQRFKYLEKRCGDNYISQGGASNIQFYRMMQDLNPCMAFYPLANTIFNQGKSNICWMECTYSGAAFYGNQNLPEFNKKGILDFNDFIDFDREVLEVHNKLSWELICDEYLLSKVNQLRIERLLQ